MSVCIATAHAELSWHCLVHFISTRHGPVELHITVSIVLKLQSHSVFSDMSAVGSKTLDQAVLTKLGVCARCNCTVLMCIAAGVQGHVLAVTVL